LDKGGLTTAGMVDLEMIPEPSTYALLVLAASGLGVYALRRRGR
jgi:lysozyme family protein